MAGLSEQFIAPQTVVIPHMRGIQYGLSLMSLEYRIARWSLSSGGRSADPVAGDDS
jgi:hypothetical protein